jgi:hypothetical protein
MKRGTLFAIAAAGCAAIGVAAWGTLAARKAAPPQVVQGDGVNGPTGMAWVRA